MTMVATVTWEGQERRVVRLAHGGDKGFDPDAPPDSQVVVKMGDGSEIVVPITGDDTVPPATEPPTVVDAPYVSQAGSNLNCTMGNWNGEPTSRSYRWQLDGLDVGLDDPNYPVTPEDVGKSAVCVLTAINAAGSAESTSNAITVV
jgi:hypothetical protein